MLARPTYETSNDKRLEAAVAEEFAAHHGMTVTKLGDKYAADFGIMRDKVLMGAVEIKVRDRDYPEFMLSLAKCQNLRALAAWGLLVRVLFATPTGIYAQPITCNVAWSPRGTFEMVGDGYGGGWIGLGGRTDRGDPDDVEPVVYWRQATMKRVCASRKEWFK